MRATVLLQAALLALVAGAILAVQVIARPGGQVEEAVQRYAAAVGAQDLKAALAEVAPSERARWAPFIESQLGNAYDVKAVSVRSASLLDQLTRGASGLPVEATVVMDVNRGYPELFYQPTERVAVTGERGQWFLRAPLLAPEG